MRRALTAILLTLSLTACGKDDSSGTKGTAGTTAAATKTVTIKDFKYDPETVTVKVGDTVKWVNKDGMKHSATRDAADPKFDTGVVDPSGESAPIRFDTASDAAGWQYRCKVPGHEKMKGFVVVTK